MSLSSVPDDGEMLIADLPMQGRRLRAANGTPVAWAGEKVISYRDWSEMARMSAKSGLQPFLLPARDAGHTSRPRYASEQLSEPEDAGDVDRLDAARELERRRRGRAPGEDEFASWCRRRARPTSCRVWAGQEPPTTAGHPSSPW